MPAQLNADETLVPERRRYARHDALFSSAELGNSNSGIILNISEAGVALHAVSEILRDELTNLRFQISLNEPWIEAKGRIVWRSQSKRTAGMQFIDLPETSRDSIKKWIAQTSKLSENDVSGELESRIVAEETSSHIGNAVVAKDTASRPNADSSGGLPSVRIPFQQTVVENETKPRLRHRSLAYVAGGLFLLATAGYLAWREEGTSQTIRAPKTAADSSATSANGSDSSISSILHPPSSSQIPAHQTPASSEYGFVLQVAALKNAKNALALADELRQKNFSVFVTKSSGSDLYRVLVGPYTDASSAIKSQADLRKEGFPSVRQENKPAQ